MQVAEGECGKYVMHFLRLKYLTFKKPRNIFRNKVSPLFLKREILEYQDK